MASELKPRTFWALLGPFALLLLAVAGGSLQWRMVVDTPVLVYEGFIMDAFGLVPYRDFFDMNMPGTLLLHRMLAAVAGRGDLAMRVVELIWLGAILAVTWTALRRISRQVAAAAAVLFGLAHLAYGPYYGLQRELLLLLPVALSVAILAAPSLPRPLAAPVTRTLLAGLCIGAACTIKPHAAISLPLVVLFQWRGGPEGAGGPGPAPWRHPLAALGGAAAFPAAVAAWLAATGALGPFLEITSGYWPLYTRMTVSHQTISGIDRWIYMIRGLSRVGEQGLWLAPAALGLTLALFHSSLDAGRRRLVALLAAHAGAYAVYPLFAGQFWVYHYLPLMYFLVLLSSLCLAPAGPSLPRAQRAVAVGLLMVVALFRAHPPLEFVSQVAGDGVLQPRLERVDQMAAFLGRELRPGDTVQPLDWTGGAVHAMLVAGAPPATPFLYDFHFYHHVSDPYIQGLRARFVAALERERPRFIIRVEEDKPWPWGRDTTRSFVALEGILARDYRPVLRGEGYTLLERVAGG